MLLVAGDDDGGDAGGAISGARKRIEQRVRRIGDQARGMPAGLVAQSRDQVSDGGGVGPCDQQFRGGVQIDGRHGRISVGETPKLSAGWTDDTASGA